MRRALALIDGEHYPPVIEAALATLAGRGHEVVGAVFLGGWEKTGRVPELGIPVWEGRAETLVPELIRTLSIEEVIDTSDEPVLDARRRRILAGLTIAAGAHYLAGGMHLDPPQRPRLTTRPSVAVIGTGKRTGKTALAIGLARHWREQGWRPCIVTMGRGGPPEPVVLRADQVGDTLDLVDRLRRRGLHATSDYVEDAVFARVDTVGTRRLGAGPAGVTVDDGFAAGVAAAEGLDPDLLLFEGSGTAVPPARADLTVVATPGEDPEALVGSIGISRLAMSDAIVVFGPVAPLREALAGILPDTRLLRASLFPEPSVPVEGRRVLVVTTAPPRAGWELVDGLRRQGASTVRCVHSLSDRRRLPAEIGDLSDVDLVLTEVKAAAADIVIPAARRAGVEAGLIHNAVELKGGLGQIADRLAISQSSDQAITR